MSHDKDKFARRLSVASLVVGVVALAANVFFAVNARDSAETAKASRLATERLLAADDAKRADLTKQVEANRVTLESAEVLTPSAYTTGWVDDADARAALLPTVLQFADTPAFKAVQGDEPKAVYLWESYTRLFGRPPPERNQNPIGSCVSFGTASAIESTLATQVVQGGAGEYRDIAQEVIYAGSRVEIGRGQLGSADGSVGIWAAKFVTGYGVLSRGVYGTLDLSRYDPARCRSWGRTGVPDGLEPECRKFPVKDAANVRTWAEAKKSLASGYGIAVCSNVGFNKPGTPRNGVNPATRDEKGRCQPSGVWPHCMALDGYHIEADGSEWGHITNSWGASAHLGPVGWGSPNKAGFWTDSETVDRMLRQGDSFAYSGATGFPRNKIVWEQTLTRTLPPKPVRPADLLSVAW